MYNYTRNLNMLVYLSEWWQLLLKLLTTEQIDMNYLYYHILHAWIIVQT